MEGRRALSFLCLALGSFLLFISIFNNKFNPLSSNNFHTVRKVRVELHKLYPNNHNHNHDHTTDVPRHPLDPLTVQEMNAVQSILSMHTLFKYAKTFALHSVVLEEPPKPLVIRWRDGDPLLPRKASVIARVDGVSYVVSVDLGRGQVNHVDTGSGSSGYPVMTIEDTDVGRYTRLVSSVLNRTILDRGVALEDLACVPLSTGMHTSKTRHKLFY